MTWVRHGRGVWGGGDAPAITCRFLKASAPLESDCFKCEGVLCIHNATASYRLLLLPAGLLLTLVWSQAGLQWTRHITDCSTTCGTGPNPIGFGSGSSSRV